MLHAEAQQGQASCRPRSAPALAHAALAQHQQPQLAAAILLHRLHRVQQALLRGCRQLAQAGPLALALWLLRRRARAAAAARAGKPGEVGQRDVAQARDVEHLALAAARRAASAAAAASTATLLCHLVLVVVG